MACEVQWNISETQPSTNEELHISNNSKRNRVLLSASPQENQQKCKQRKSIENTTYTQRRIAQGCKRMQIDIPFEFQTQWKYLKKFWGLKTNSDLLKKLLEFWPKNSRRTSSQIFDEDQTHESVLGIEASEESVLKDDMIQPFHDENNPTQVWDEATSLEWSPETIQNETSGESSEGEGDELESGNDESDVLLPSNSTLPDTIPPVHPSKTPKRSSLPDFFPTWGQIE